MAARNKDRAAELRRRLMGGEEASSVTAAALSAAAASSGGAAQHRSTRIDDFSGVYEFLSLDYPAIVTYTHHDSGEVQTFSSALLALFQLRFGGVRQYDVRGPYSFEKYEDNYDEICEKVRKECELLDERADWATSRLGILDRILRDKFHRSSELREKLVETGHRELVWENSVFDIFFGQVAGKGQNQLGRLLMGIRSSIANNTATEEWLFKCVGVAEKISQNRPVVLEEIKDGAVMERHELSVEKAVQYVGREQNCVLKPQHPSRVFGFDYRGTEEGVLQGRFFAQKVFSPTSFSKSCILKRHLPATRRVRIFATPPSRHLPATRRVRLHHPPGTSRRHAAFVYTSMLPPPGTSRRHAAFVYTSYGDFGVTDVGSKAGTKVNRAKLAEGEFRALKSGDEVTIGESTRFYRVCFDDSAYQRQLHEQRQQLGQDLETDDALTSLLQDGGDEPVSCFLGGLEPSVTVSDLMDLFAEASVIKDVLRPISIRLPQEGMKGAAPPAEGEEEKAVRGFGFALFANKQLARKACLLDGLELKGKRITIRLEQQKGNKGKGKDGGGKDKGGKGDGGKKGDGRKKGDGGSFGGKLGGSLGKDDHSVPGGAAGGKGAISEARAGAAASSDLPRGPSGLLEESSVRDKRGRSPAGVAEKAPAKRPRSLSVDSRSRSRKRKREGKKSKKKKDKKDKKKKKKRKHSSSESSALSDSR